MEQEALIAVNDVSRYYGERCAVGNLSFQTRRGEILGFLGPNGAGKTTTMQMIAGVLAPTRGQVTIAGHDIVEAPKAAKSQIGYLPEHPPLYPDLSVDQYLDYCARLRRIPRTRRALALRTSKERCGLENVGARLIGNLSKGYQQRVGIAQAIIHSPTAVILDEPTVGLDPNQIVEMRERIRELGRDHSVILSTHILSEVQAICDRVLIINEGRLILDETIAGLRGRQELACTVALHKPPDNKAIRAVEGVTGVKRLEGNRYRVTYREGTDTPAALAEAAARGGWKLYELVPAAGTLEETFLRLTRGDAPAGPEETA